MPFIYRPQNVPLGRPGNSMSASNPTDQSLPRDEGVAYTIIFHQILIVRQLFALTVVYSVLKNRSDIRYQKGGLNYGNII